MTAQEHLEWAKGRALLYCLDGHPYHALLSLLSDFNKHEELKNHPAREGCELILLNKAIYENTGFVYKYISDICP